MEKRFKGLFTALALLLFFCRAPLNVQAASYSCLPNGTYFISTAMSDGQVMDITGNNNGNGLVIWNKNNGENQQFLLNHTGDGWYRISNRGSNKVIDLEITGSVKKGSKLVLNDYSGKSSQLFRFYSAGNGYYYIQNKSGYYLDVYGGTPKAGSVIQAFPKLDQHNQMWKLTSADGGYATDVTGQFYFQAGLNSNLVMDITGYQGEGTAYPNGSNIVLWNSNKGRNQRFNVAKARDDWYKIINETTGKAVTVWGGKGVCGEKIATSSFDESDAQMWRFYDAGNGYYYVKNKLGYYLDVYNGNNQAGTILVTWMLNKGNNQKWKLASVNQTSTPSETNTNNAYDSKVSAFLSDSRWRPGVWYGASQRPKISSYSCSGCCAYAADFVKYVYGKNSPTSGTAFYNPSQIRSGDVIKVVGSQHWFVVLYRNGNALTTVEGNWTNGCVVRSSTAYTVSGNTLLRDGKVFRTFSAGYHFQ